VVIRKVDKENRERSELKNVQGRMTEALFPSSIWYIDEQDKRSYAVGNHEAERSKSGRPNRDLIDWVGSGVP
jgi:hypothetical protein